MDRSPGFQSLNAKQLAGVGINPRCDSSTLAVPQCSHGHSHAVLCRVIEARIAAMVTATQSQVSGSSSHVLVITQFQRGVSG